MNKEETEEIHTAQMIITLLILAFWVWILVFKINPWAQTKLDEWGFYDGNSTIEGKTLTNESFEKNNN